MKNFAKIKIQLQEYQKEKYPQLTSIVEHGKGSHARNNDDERQMKERTNKPSGKDEIIIILNQAFKESISPDDFYSKASEQGLSLYERSGSIGIQDNRNYRLETLGFGAEKLNELNVREERMNELDSLFENDNKDMEWQREYAEDEEHKDDKAVREMDK